MKFIYLCGLKRGDERGKYIFSMRCSNVGMDCWSLYQMKVFQYAGGMWLVPRLGGKAWGSQQLPVDGGRADLGVGMVRPQRQIVLTVTKGTCCCNG